MWINSVWDSANVVAAMFSPTVRPIIAPLLHGSYSHFIGNVVMLLAFGYYVEPETPSSYYGAMLLVATYLDVLLRWGGEVSIGISGFMYAIGGFYGLYFAKKTIVDYRRNSFEFKEVESAIGITALVAVPSKAIGQHIGVLTADPRLNTTAHLLGFGVGVLAFGLQSIYGG
jgi:membrane associated rhomboid family serine protease